MIGFIQMKREEWKFKRQLYKSLNLFADNCEELLRMSKKMSAALKDIPPGQLYEDFISNLIKIIHEDNKKKAGFMNE
ncbi:MAG: hypothetical protein HFG54_14970 [Lachnospiraceae bacterium]|jgi:hypothetical protein|nr:hypothetical protein [Lachnospiraceae bacterium]